jgi:hypothetical protein
MSSLKFHGRRLKATAHTIRHAAVWTLSVVLLLSQVTVSAFAQNETGQISGTVLDPTGAVVSGASVIIKSIDTGAERRTTTNDSGAYTLTALQPGVYDVRVEAGGFAPKTQRAQVTVGAKVALDITLSAQASSEEVTVVAGESGVAVNTETQQLSSTVTQRQIVELPTLTRNPYALVQLAGNISPGDASDPAGATVRGAGFAINGQRAASTNILLDGVDNNDLFTASVGQSVPLDSVQEFQVITGNFSAEFGRASGGIVNVATKSGSNSFHGTLYEFNRVSALASNGFQNNAIGAKKPVFTRNQFGYSAGGPILKDKLFFFSSTEWTRVRSVATVTSLVPTAAFIAQTAPATRNFFSAYQLTQPINGRVLTKNDLDALGVTNATGPFSQLPGNLPIFGQVIQDIPGNAGGGNPQNAYQTVERADWNISDKTQIYGRYALQSQNLLAGVVATSPYAGFDTGNTLFNNNTLVSMTHTFSPRWVSQTKLAYNRLNGSSPLGEQPVGPTLYFFATRAATIGQDFVAFPGYLPFTPGSALPVGGPQNVIQLNEDLNYTRGKHSFRIGGQYEYIQNNRTFGAFENSVETLGTTLAGGLDNLVRGKLLAFQGAINPQGKFPGEAITLLSLSRVGGLSQRFVESASARDAQSRHAL